MTVFEAVIVANSGGTSSECEYRSAIDRVEVTFDDESLVADAGLIVPATLMLRLGLEALVNADGAAGRPGRWRPAGPQGAHVGGGDPARGAATSITPTSCGPGRPSGCCRSG